MGKKLTLIGVLVVALLAAGCAGNDLAVFRRAQQRTEAITRGNDSISMVMTVKFKEQGMAGLQSNAGNTAGALQDLRLDVRQVFDNRQQTRLAKIYANINGTGIDGKLYRRGEQYFLVSPIFPRILVIEPEKLAGFAPKGSVGADSQPELPEGLLQKLNDIWLRLLKKENVVHLGNTILSTPDGEVKAKEFTIKLGEAEIKPAIKESLDVLLQDTTLQQKLQEYVPELNPDQFQGRDQGQHPDVEYKLDIRKVLTQQKDMLDLSAIENFNYNAYIDRDGYVVEENIQVAIRFVDPAPQMPEGASMNIKIQRWDIEKEVRIDFPEVTQENTITLDDLRQEAMFKLPGGNK